MRLRLKGGRGAFWDDDGGFSTLGMAIALLDGFAVYAFVTLW